MVLSRLSAQMSHTCREKRVSAKSHSFVVNNHFSLWSEIVDRCGTAKHGPPKVCLTLLSLRGKSYLCSCVPVSLKLFKGTAC